MDYEVVYSAALERQGLGMSLSGFMGSSTLNAFGAEDSLHFGDVVRLYEKVLNAPVTRKLRKHGRGPINRDKRWHANRSTRAA